MEKKVLIITYYWPPSGGSGVQRWLKFVKYLPEFGWAPHVFTPENPSFAIQDRSLVKDVPPSAEVIRFPIWEPYDLFVGFSKLMGRKQQSLLPTHVVPGRRGSILQQTVAWIRGNLFIPDPKRFWVGPSVRFLEHYVQANRIKTIITTGPPHSVHLIGYRLRKKLPLIRWLADFRDPWSQWGLQESLKLGLLARSMHRRLEAKVLRTADEVLTITPFYVRQFEGLSNRRVRLLTNGFDEADFEGIRYTRPEMFTIRHVGIINERCDPRPFMTALKQLIQSNDSFGLSMKLEFVGEVHPAFKSEVTADEVLNQVTVFAGSIQHDELITRYGNSSLLLIVLNGYKDAEGYMPGKLFEYLATGLPVLGIGPSQGDAAALLNETHAGVMLEATNTTGILEFLRSAQERWKMNPERSESFHAYKKYTRRELTRSLTDLL